jgi:site-specific recombinase XerD
MINRQNWLDTRLFLRYLVNVRQSSPETVDRTRAHLRHLLAWADETLLARAAHIMPTLPAYLVDRALSPSSIKKGLEAARHFFTFARDHWPQRYRPIHVTWIDTLQPPRGSRLDSRLPVHEFFTLDAVRQIVTVSAETLRHERAQVAAAMLFLSGMRADAFATLPISCVHLDRREIRQDPALGVRTKNRKAALTYLMDIPDLFAVVEKWHRRLADLAPECLWYSPLTRDGMTLIPTAIAFVGRGDLVGHDLRIACYRAGVPYLSPHKLRHGFVVHAIKQARTMAELKAISQNVMHASVTITDQVYGRLVGDDVRQIISSLGKQTPLPFRVGGRSDQIDQLIAILEEMRSQ